MTTTAQAAFRDPAEHRAGRLGGTGRPDRWTAGANRGAPR
ncbi:MAG: hypothetical protein QOI83_804 [Streptomycetaceae bacterium]|jgi:hypothetical protein|nr:hypothetical protein [Streptomycetaceae bacterium]